MLPDLEPEAIERSGRVLGIVLAAGTGSRFAGENKLLAPIDGEPLVRHAARTLATPVVDRTLAVLGHEADAVREAIAPAVDETLVADGYSTGLSASVAAGARQAAERDVDAVVFLPGDMPLVGSETVGRLVAAFDAVRSGTSATGPETARAAVAAVVPERDGRRGNPVLFGASQFDALRSLSGDVGGRALFESIAVESVSVPDPGIHVDVDTRAELARIRDRRE